MIYKNRRSEVEIIDTILSGIHHEAKKTRLMNSAHICYYQFGDYFTFLLENGFIAEKKIGSREKIYVITERGKRLHDNIKSLLAFTSNIR